MEMWRRFSGTRTDGQSEIKSQCNFMSVLQLYRTVESWDVRLQCPFSSNIQRTGQLWHISKQFLLPWLCHSAFLIESHSLLLSSSLPEYLMSGSPRTAAGYPPRSPNLNEGHNQNRWVIIIPETSQMGVVVSVAVCDWGHENKSRNERETCWLK